MSDYAPHCALKDSMNAKPNLSTMLVCFYCGLEERMKYWYNERAEPIGLECIRCKNWHSVPTPQQKDVNDTK